jgi:hypothetical protein
MKFFTETNLKRRNNSIKSLFVHGLISTDHVKIREHIVQFYRMLYTEQFSWQLKFDGLSFDSIGEVKPNWLERAISHWLSRGLKRL